MASAILVIILWQRLISYNLNHLYMYSYDWVLYKYSTFASKSTFARKIQIVFTVSTNFDIFFEIVISGLLDSGE